MYSEINRNLRCRLTAVLIGAALLMLVGAGTAAHADTPDPQLSISVEDGATAARSGDKLVYTITLTNLGPKKVKDLQVSQTVPTGASVLSATSQGDRSKGKIGWSVDLAAAQKVTLRTTMALGTTPVSALRLATVACAQVSAKGPALVCATDSDELPAGAAADRTGVDAPPVAGRWLDGRTPWYAGGGAALLLAAAGAALVVRRRRGAGGDVGARPGAQE